MKDKEVKDAIAAIWTSAATELGEPLRVIKRWKLRLRGNEVLAALRSLDNNKKINGLYITRSQRKSKKVGANHWEYHWVYTMAYFRTYDEGTDASNSEDKMNALLEEVAERFEDTPDLDLEPDDERWTVDTHDELQVENTDTIDLKVNAAMCSLTVRLTKQG